MQSTLKFEALETIKQTFIEKTQFSVNNIESTFEKLDKYDVLTPELQSIITNVISSEYQNLIVKFIENTTLVHIQFGQPLNQLAPKASEFNLKNIQAYKPTVKSLIFDVKSGKVVSYFDLLRPVVPYIKNQKQQMIEDMTQHIKSSIETNKADNVFFSTYWIPYGITFQCVYSGNSWIMTTAALHKINEATFGSNKSFQTIIETIMEKNGIKLDKMDKNAVYTFHVAIKNLSFIPVENDKLYVQSIKYRNTMKQKDNDYIWKKMHHIKESYIKAKPISDCGYSSSLLFGLNSQFERYAYQYNIAFPMQSLIVVIGTNQYEIMTPIKELIINFNVYRKNKGVRSDTHIQFDEYLQEAIHQNTKNTYIKQYLENPLTDRRYPILAHRDSEKDTNSQQTEQLNSINKQ